MKQPTRKQMLNNLNRKRNNLIKQGARLNELDEVGGLGFSVERLGNLSDSQLSRMYKRANEYGSLTVVGGAVLPKEYLRRIKAQSEFHGRDPNTIPLKKSYGSVRHAHIMTGYTSVNNMLNKLRRHQQETQQNYTNALKNVFGLKDEAFKIAQMPRLVFAKFLGEVGYHATASYVLGYASNQDTHSDMMAIAQLVRREIHASKTYKEFTPNLIQAVKG